MSAPITPIAADVEQSLSFAQEGLWFSDQLDPGHPVYNVYRVLRLTGALDTRALEAALNEIVRRHESLRTAFPTRDGRPVRSIAPELRIALPIVDAEGADRVARERDMLGRAADEAATPMFVDTLPLFRALLVRLDERVHVLVLTVHHIAADAWSLQVLLQELAVLYNDFSARRAPSLAPLPIQERDFAFWQRNVQIRGFDRDIAYWRGRLGGAPETLALPLDRPRPASMSFRGARHAVVIPADVGRAVRDLSAREGVTGFMTLLAAYGVMLHARTGQRDILVGTPVAGRSRVETEGLIGAFLNTLIFRLDVRERETFQGLLARVRTLVLEAFAHGDVPFNKVVEALRVQRTLGRSPLLHVKFRLQNVPPARLEFDGLDARLEDLDYGFVKGDLGLELVERGDELAGFFEYSTDLFDAATVAGFAADFLTTLRQVVSAPHEPLPTTGLVSNPPPRQPAMPCNEEAAPRRSLKGMRREAIALAPDTLVRTSRLRDGEAFPALVEPVIAGVDLVEWARRNTDEVDRLLLEHKAILFRGFPVRDVAEFEQFAKACTRTLLSYTNRSTPRSQVSGDVYTSTEFPADQSIPMHNEMSYTTSWPMKLWFHCVTPATTGGETPFADSALVYQRLGERTRDAFATKGVLYVRNFGAGIDLPWQDVFQTADRDAVERFCADNGIEWEWLPNDRLRTRQLSQGVATHPVTGETVFMNQAHLFNVQSLAPSVRDAILASFAPEDIPRNSYYGDGTDIQPETLAEIARVYDETSIAFPWQAGDVMMLDNMRVAHGRRPFSGARKIVVAMAEAYSPPR